jgi:hypothetical protein
MHNSSTYTKRSKPPSKNGVLSVVQASETDKQTKNCRLFPPSKPLLYYPKRYIRYSTYLIIMPQGAAGSTEENAYRRRDWVTDAGKHTAEFFKLQTSNCCCGG